MINKGKKATLLSFVGTCFLLFGSSTFAKEYKAGDLTSFKDWKSFCESVPFWQKGLEVPGNEVYKKFGFEPINANAIMKKNGNKTVLDNRFHYKKNKNGWLFIDARSKPDRSAGTIRRSVSITSDYSFEKNKEKNPKLAESDASRKLNEFRDESTFLALLNDGFKLGKAKKTYNKIADIDKEIVLFCNGKKCHRSTWGACMLRTLGYKKPVKIMLGGFPEWKDAGLPTN